MLRAEFWTEVDCVAGVVDVDFHGPVRECEREDKGVLAPAVVGCICVVRVVAPGHVGA